MSRHHQADRSRWRRVRQAVLERNDWRCERCPATAAEVHHVIPVARGGAMYDPRNLESLCRTCHLESHDRRTPDQVEWDRYVTEVFQ